MTAADELLILLKPLGSRACDVALEWCADFATLEQAWSECQRGDWMAWLAGALSGESMSEGRRRLARVLVEIVGPVVASLEDPRPRECIALLSRWANGDDSVTKAHLRAAAADAAAHAAYTAAAGAAADAAAHAAAHAAFAAAFAATAAWTACAAYAAGNAAGAAGNAASAATDAAAAAAAAAATMRKHYPEVPR